MINVQRGPEPPALQSTREKRLRVAIESFNEHGPGSEPLIKGLVGYDIAKPYLFRRQHKKCAYCERYTPLDEAPTEHFRPKAYARRDWCDDEAIEEDRTRYWWLTWSWENLLFSCNTCNGKSHKNNRFPLAPRTEPLAAPSHPCEFPLSDAHFDLATERPLLLDPADLSVDPLDHFRWRPLNPEMSPAQWTFGVRGIKARGRVTMRVLRLDERAPFVNSAYRDLVWPRFRSEILPKLKLNRAAVVAAWTKLTSDLIRPEAEFAAAKWCMLDELRTSSRAVMDQELPTPPRPWRPPGS